MINYVSFIGLTLMFNNPIAGAIVACSAAIALLWAIAEYFKPVGKRGSKTKLPPGPPGLPVFGNLFDMKDVKSDPQHKFLSSLAQYGEMATVHLGSKTWIMLNSERVAHELFNKRSSVTNGRSPMPISSGIVSRNRRSLLLPHAPWAEMRRVMHPLLSGTALKTYGDWQEQESNKMMASYLKEPELWYQHHYRYANSVILRIALGEKPDYASKELADLQDVQTTFINTIGASLIDWFPALDRVPRFLQPWRPHWNKIGQQNYDVFRTWWKPVHVKLGNGTAPPSFVRDVLLHKNTKYKGDEQDAMYLTMQLIEAGSGTTRESLNIMVMASLFYPDVFKKARAEVDRVCGSKAERLPVIEDMVNLGYICAVAKELLRWRPIFPIATDHVATQDIEFEGYYFPAGVGFVLNGICLSNECEAPDEFKPERWMNGHELDPLHGVWQFGGGRRVCVGYRLGFRSLFLNIARLVYCFDYTTAGRMDSKALNSATTEEPFPVEVNLRSEAHEQLIVQETEKQENT